MLMRLAAILSAFTLSGNAYSFVTLAALDDMVQQAVAVVRVKVVKIEPLSADAEWPTVTTVEVQKVLAGKCEKILKILYGVAIQEPPEDALAANAEYYLCIEPAREHPGLFREINYGSGKMPVKADGVDMSGIRPPEWMKDLPKTLPPAEVEDLLVWLRGPELSVKALNAAQRCDEPLELELTLRNPSARPMRLTHGFNGAFSANFEIILYDDNGFVVAQNISGNRNSYDENNYGEFSGDDMRGTRVLQPNGALNGKAKFYIRMDEFCEDPADARTVEVRYSSHTNEKPEKDMWMGQVRGRGAIKLACPFRRWAARFRKPNSEWSVDIEAPRTVLPRQSPKVSVWFNPSPLRGIEEGSVPTKAAADDLQALMGCVQLERDGQRLPALKEDSERVRAWLARAVQNKERPEVQLDLAKHYTLIPGAYTMHLVVPGTRSSSVSNTINFEIPLEDVK